LADGPEPQQYQSGTSSAQPVQARRASTGQGPGSGYVPPALITILTLAVTLVGALVLYTLWVFWPTSGQEGGPTTAGTQSIDYFGWSTSVNREFLFFLVVALAGALGGLIHTIRSAAWYVGNRELKWSWLPFNLLLPIVGALGGTVFYLVLRAGLFSPSTSAAHASPFGFAAVAVLAGLFSEQALEKLRELAANLFAERPKGGDHVGPDRTDET
jgi:hypothetical protein